VKFWHGDLKSAELIFYWHPVRKQFRAQGEAEWTKLPPGQGIVALLLHLFGKKELQAVPHFADIARLERGESLRTGPSVADGASPASVQPGESHRVGHARAENSRTASPKEPTDEDMARWAEIDEAAEAEIHSWEGGQR